ncbi:MAG: uroporphyrinogen-III synthase, partial [Ktedonobacterales bacterium]|nr:uroporphyrinogen-III synthase [Ktedonobacterales bacterium]
VNGVAAFAERLAATERDWRVVRSRVAAIGPATAAALRERGLRPDFIPTEFVAEAVAAQIGNVAGQCILLPRADIARPALAMLLRDAGATVDEVAAYRTITPPLEPEAVTQALRDPWPDAITFTSSSTVRGFVAALGGRDPVEALAGIVIACIGPITADTAQSYGLEPDVVATEYTMEGLTAALSAALATPHKK